MESSSIIMLYSRIGLALLAFVVALMSKWLIDALRMAWLVRNIPGPSEGSFFGGQVSATTGIKGHRVLQRWSDKYGGFFKIRTYWRQTIIFADPFIMDELVQLERQGAIDKVPNPNKSELHIVNEETSGPLWKVVRKGVAPAFNTGNIRKYHHHVVHVMDCLIEAIKRGGPNATVDMADVAQRESFDVIGKVGFGTDFGTRNNITKAPAPGFARGKNIFDIFQKATAELWKIASNPLRPYLWFLPSMKDATANTQQLTELGRDLLMEVQSRGPPAADDVTIGAHMLRVRDPATKQPLSQTRLTQEFVAFLLAGSETTGYTIAWTLFQLLRHPKALAKLEAELDAAGLLATPERPNPRAVTYADIQLPYLQACIKETMRMRSAVPFGFRRVAKQDIHLSNGAMIPRGMFILGSALASMTSPRFWGRDADLYIPERWEEADPEHIERHEPPQSADPGTDKASPSDKAGTEEGHDKVRKFHPFGDGLRSCVGQNLARMNIPTAVAMLVCHFHMTLDDSIATCDPQEMEALRITLQFENGLPMRCTPRVLTAA